MAASGMSKVSSSGEKLPLLFSVVVVAQLGNSSLSTTALSHEMSKHVGAVVVALLAVVPAGGFELPASPRRLDVEGPSPPPYTPPTCAHPSCEHPACIYQESGV